MSLVVILLSVTLTCSNLTSPVLVTSKVIFMIDPFETYIPGAVLTSWPLIFLIILTAGVAFVYALALSSAVERGGTVPLRRVKAWLVTEALFVCWIIGSGAANVAVQVITSAGFKLVLGQVINEILSSVTNILFKRALPVLLTSKVMFIVEPFGTSTPGIVFASSPLIFLTILILGSIPIIPPSIVILLPLIGSITVSVIPEVGSVFESKLVVVADLKVCIKKAGLINSTL